MEMIDRAIPLAEGAARSDTGFDVADGCFDCSRDGVENSVFGAVYIAGYCCCLGERILVGGFMRNEEGRWGKM